MKLDSAKAQWEQLFDGTCKANLSCVLFALTFIQITSASLAGFANALTVKWMTRRST